METVFSASINAIEGLDLSVYEEIYGGVTGANYFLPNFFLIFVVYSPFAILSCFAFKKHLKLSLPVFIIIAVAFTAAISVFLYIVEQNIWHIKQPQFSRIITLTHSAMWLTGLILCRLTIKIRWTKLLYVLFTALAYMRFVTGTEQYANSYLVITYIPISSHYLISTVLRTIITVITIPFTILVIIKTVKPAIERIESSVWKYLWILPAFIYFIFYVNQIVYSLSYPMELENLIITILLQIAALLLNHFAFKMILQTDESARLAQSIIMTEQQLALQEEHYNMLRTNIEETKRARHDLRHHLNVFRTFINTGDTAKLAEYIDKYNESLPDDTGFSYCANYAVNSILFYYIAIAKREGIVVEVHTDIPEKTSVNDSDLCIIFGNCIENAIEACRRMTGERFIIINAAIAGKKLAVTIDNSFDGNILKDDNKIMSRKNNGSKGIGLSSIEAVARKYNGKARFEVKDNLFQVSVMLGL